jgi:hypothetical protein
MIFVYDEGMRMPSRAVQMRMIERKVIVSVFKGLRVFAGPET